LPFAGQAITLIAFWDAEFSCHMTWPPSAESVFRFCEIASILAGILAVFAGVVTVVALVGQVLSGRIIGERKNNEMLRLQADVAKQQARAADAETRLADAEIRLLELKSRISWRKLRSIFAETLKARSNATAVAEIVYQPDDGEAYAFASEIEEALSSAGWKVSVKQGAAAEPSKHSQQPFLLREGGLLVSDWSTVLVLTQGPLADKPFKADTPLDAIMAAFKAAQIPALQTIPHEGLRPQDGTIRLVIGSRL
jgi:hypothetical protein